MNWTWEQYNEFKRKQVVAKNSPTLPAPDVEPIASHESVAKKESPRLDSSGRVHLRITGYRHRLCDPDGQSAKALVDSFVLANVLTDDSTKQIEGIEMRQEKVKKDQLEETVVEFYQA